MQAFTLFYHPDISETCILSEEESKHAIRVLRMNIKDEIFLTDGKGRLFKAEIIEANPKKCAVKITAELSSTGLPGLFENSPALPERVSSPPSAHLHLAVALTKNTDRYEWLLEKATEIGVNEITPLVCEHSERKKVNNERLGKILVSAMKQSLNLFLPVLNPLRNFPEFVAISLVQKNKENKVLQKFIAHYSETHLKNCYRKGNDALILIGPEGDFSDREIRLAVNNGFTEVSLGKSRLRTETAAIVACHTISLANED